MGVDGGSTNRWRSERERDRLRARHVIRSRVASRVVGDLDPPSSGRHRFDDDSCGEAGGISDSSVQERTVARGEAEVSLRDMNVILRHLQAVITRDTSAFSQVKLAAVGRLLNRPFPTPSVVVDGRDFSNDLIHPRAHRQATPPLWAKHIAFCQRCFPRPSPGGRIEMETPPPPVPPVMHRNRHGWSFANQRRSPPRSLGGSTSRIAWSRTCGDFVRKAAAGAAS